MFQDIFLYYTAMLEKLAEQSKTKEQKNEQHYFSIQSGNDLVENFSFIQSQLKNEHRVASKYHFTGEPIHHTIETTPMTKKMGVEVLLDHKKDMQVTMISPNGEVVKQYSQGDKYNLYKVDNPEVGQWDISIEGKGANKITLAICWQLLLPFQQDYMGKGASSLKRRSRI